MILALLWTDCYFYILLLFWSPKLHTALEMRLQQSEYHGTITTFDHLAMVCVMYPLMPFWPPQHIVDSH